MDRKLLLVFALTFLAIMLFQPLLKKYGPQPPAEPEKKTQPAAAPSPAPAVPAEAPAPVRGVTKQATSEAETVIENDRYKITFSNRGGQVKSWILKKYDDDNGQPLELVNPIASAKYGLPLSLWAYDQGLRNKLNSALYVASHSGTLTAPADVTFEYGDQDLVVLKRFSFDHSYVVHVETSVRYRGSDLPALPMWPSGLGDETSPASYGASRIEYQYNDKIERLAIKKISSGNTLNGPLHWAGVVDQYFAAVFLPQDPPNAALVTLRNAVDVPKDPKNPQDTTKVEVLGTAVGNLHGPTVERLFVGPKALDVLESVRVPGAGSHADLRDLVNFGFFGIIARALFIWLKWTYQHMVRNWGWAIVIQTLIINIALLPLRISQMKSMLKMQKIQPQIKSIQEKYKKYSMRDPRKQEMQQEISALYKKEGVNPVGGCLPMLIQLPFLYAYYAMLGVALDLRHAHWLWIRDLSGPDPWHLLPIGIIITMFLTQRMTPQTGMDPTQQKMMNFMMPVFLGVISWNLAAGLCLYWAESTLIGIVQQVFLNRSSLGQEMREMMEKRARKNKK
ncbi:MAG TPA: membrane protein insertase YidC [Terriglobales bacterium]|nr:membrane protein insertase YidC [Terriglobales bacterium]